MKKNPQLGPALRIALHHHRPLVEVGDMICHNKIFAEVITKQVHRQYMEDTVTPSFY